MTIHDVQQGSVEWLQLRAGIPTASDFDALVTPLGKIRIGDGVRSYLAKKVAEAWQGGPLLEYNSWTMEDGQILESEARPWAEIHFGCDIQQVGFITSDDGKIGCSPDGLISDDCGIEIKCPKVETHVGYLLAGELPSEYIAQVQGSMFVTGFNQWKFLSYRRRFPNLVLTIERDEKFQNALADALAQFLGKFEESMRRMEEINGGPRPKAFKREPVPVPTIDDGEITP